MCAEYRATARWQPGKDCRQPKHPHQPPETNRLVSKKVCRSSEMECRQTFIQIQCIADYWSLSPFMEMRNSWLLIVFSSLFFINSIASTLFISAR